MEANRSDESRITVICLSPHSTPAYGIFNPNDWKDDSKAVVQACATECSLLFHAATRIAEICRSPGSACSTYIDSLKEQWNMRPFDLAKTVVFCEIPDLHLAIEGFFSGVKSLLDLLAQLLSTQCIVSTRIDGFHRDGDVFGGRVLKSLRNNVRAENRVVASKLERLINDHKALWIDEVINARDRLIHPDLGARQLMFEVGLRNSQGTLELEDVFPPRVGTETIAIYSHKRLANTYQFSRAFLSAAAQTVSH